LSARVVQPFRTESRPTPPSSIALMLLLVALGGCRSDQAPTAPVLSAPRPVAERETSTEPFTIIDPPGSNGAFTNPLDINNRGEIVGLYNSAPDGHRHGFLRSADGSYTTIDFPGSTATNADAINPRGDIVGHTLVSGKRHGYLRKKTGEFTQIDFPGAAATLATGINPRGDIVGIYCQLTPCSGAPGNRTTLGFLLRKGVFTTIHVPGALETRPFKINRRGKILGSYVGTEGRQHLFLLSKGDFTTIDFPGAYETPTDGGQAGLNPQGDIVSFYCDAAPCKSANIHGFLLREGEFTTIDVPGHLDTGAMGINSRGDIVGFYDADPTHIVGFLWRARER
jgi:uncharacterized membrane protein